MDALLERTQSAMVEYQGGPLMDCLPYTPNTRRLLQELADLKPRTLAIMHGPSYTGDGEWLLRGIDPILNRVFGPKDG